MSVRDSRNDDASLLMNQPTSDYAYPPPSPPIAGLPAGVLAGLRRAQRVVVLTGAGISAESGIPTFRDAQTGYWARFNPMALASPDGFAADPQQVWDWYRYRRTLCRAAQPNAGHQAVVALEAFYPEFLLITQNVDGLHSVAGSRRVLEIHGSLRRVRCAADESHPRLDWPEAWDTEGAPIPHCPCGALLRPDVVWFGEALDEADLLAANAGGAGLRGVLRHRHLGHGAACRPAAARRPAGRGRGDRSQPGADQPLAPDRCHHPGPGRRGLAPAWSKY